MALAKCKNISSLSYKYEFVEYVEYKHHFDGSEVHIDNHITSPFTFEYFL